MARETPWCRSGLSWICARLKNRRALAPLTGQDCHALEAFVHLVALYANSDEPGSQAALQAMRSTVQAMQPSTRHFAKAVIPHVLDWGDEESLWARLEVPNRSRTPIDGHEHHQSGEYR